MSPAPLPNPTPGPQPADNFYEAVGGHETFEKIVGGFYRRVPDDDILGPMYPEDDLEGARWRLTAFLEQYWGGPKTYSEVRGHPRLRMRHQPFPVDRAAAQRWLDLMGASLDDIDEETLPEEYRAAIWNHMRQVAAMLINTPDR